jgi:hypothetical protein
MLDNVNMDCSKLGADARPATKLRDGGAHDADSI